MGLSINPTKIEQLKRWVFRLSYCIIIIWSFNADVIIEYGEVYYVTPKSISLYLTLLSILQLIATCLHFILYFKANYKLTQFRANQRK